MTFRTLTWIADYIIAAFAGLYFFSMFFILTIWVKGDGDMTDREYRDYIMFNGSNVIKHTNIFL